MQNFNLHTHSVYSDGKSQPREIVEEAVRQGFTTLGFSEHSPLPFDNNFSVKSADMPRYVAEIAQLKEEFKDKDCAGYFALAGICIGLGADFSLFGEAKYRLFLNCIIHFIIDLWVLYIV